MHKKLQTSAFGRLTVVATLAAVAFCLIGASSAAYAADPANLLEQAKTSAKQLSQDADLMQSYANSRLSWESHVRQINIIKEHVNKIGKLLSQMHEARADASPAQQEAIDRLTPLLQEIASNTTSVINHLNENPTRTWSPDYKNYVSENARMTTELAGAISDFVEYEKAKTRMEDLEKKLNMGT